MLGLCSEFVPLKDVNANSLIIPRLEPFVDPYFIEDLVCEKDIRYNDSYCWFV